MKINSWKEYFSFTKKERRAIVILFLLIVSLVILPYFYTSKHVPVVADKETEQKIAQLQSSSNDSSSAESNRETTDTFNTANQVSQRQGSLFIFDPNTLDQAGWQKLGLRDKLIHTIINYRSKGGRFRAAEDIRKIYGLAEGDANRIIPYIKIEPLQNLRPVAAGRPDTVKRFDKPSPEINILHINTATAEEWKALPGIGEVLSNRIVKFRNKMGGFTSIEQVSKTYGLPDSVFQKIKPYLLLE